MNFFVCLNKPTKMFVPPVLRSRLDQGCVDKYQCVKCFRGKLFFDVKEESFGTEKKGVQSDSQCADTFHGWHLLNPHTISSYV